MTHRCEQGSLRSYQQWQTGQSDSTITANCDKIDIFPLFTNLEKNDNC